MFFQKMLPDKKSESESESRKRNFGLRGMALRSHQEQPARNNPPKGHPEHINNALGSFPFQRGISLLFTV
jgi:hypothetical protein